MIRARLAGAALAVLLAGGHGAVRAAEGFPVRAPGRPVFVLDLKDTGTGEDSVDVEVSWEIPLRELAFRPEDGVYRARYEVAVIFTRDGRQVAAELRERRVRVRTIAETREAGASSRGRYVLRLAGGRYDVRASVTDRVSNGASQASARYDARIDRAGIGLSDLRLVRYTGDGVERNPARDVPLGESGHAVRVTVRCAEGAEGSVRLQWRFTEPGGRQVADGDTTVALHGDPQTVVDIPVPSMVLLPGGHRVDVRLGSAERTDRREMEVIVHATPQWFASDPSRACEILALCADGEDVDALRGAASSGGWSAALDAFWARHDPSPGTADNEYRREILGRIDAIGTRFAEPFRYPAWKTDRGRIWMRYGQPARRSESPGDFDRPATEIWEYDAPRHVFVFVDRGSGEYWLSG